jgi:gliding motility-associated-like protein
MKKLFLIIVFITGIINANSQNFCNVALPFSTGTTYNFPAGVSSPSVQGEVGPNYGCLGSTPNPAWYYLKVCTQGNIEIYMQGTGPYDVDFTCWGPFNSPTAPCTAQLTAGSPTPTHWAAGPSPNYPTLNMIDCSFSASFEEWCYIPNAQVGKYYLLLITNYSNLTQNIIFSQTNAGQPGAGSTSGVILPPNITNNGPICQGDTLKLTAGLIPNVQYNWSGPNNWTSFVQNPKIPNASTLNSGTYYLLVAGCGDISSENTTVAVVKPRPNVVAVSDTICIGDTAIITASGANSYLWTPGNFTNSSLKLSPGFTSNYSVVGTSLGCKDTATASIKVNANPTVTVNSPGICVHDTTTLIANGALNYTWSNGVLGDSIKVSPANNTVFNVVGKDINNCIDSATSTVSVFPLPIIQLTGNTSICEGSHATLTANGGVSYVWNTIPAQTSPSITVSPLLPLTTYTIGVTDINNCFDTASISVSTTPLPIPGISLESDTICKGSSTTITASGGSSYRWNNGEITPTISVSPLNTTVYNVTVKTSVNNVICSADTNVKQNVRDCNLIFFPNSFSPYGVNTVFKPIGEIKFLKTYHFLIYNRWGQKVFETNDINEGWDGRFNGEYVQSGVYVYYIFIDNGYEGSYEKVGSVTLVD